MFHNNKTKISTHPQNPHTLSHISAIYIILIVISGNVSRFQSIVFCLFWASKFKSNMNSVICSKHYALQMSSYIWFILLAFIVAETIWLFDIRLKGGKTAHICVYGSFFCSCGVYIVCLFISISFPFDKDLVFFFIQFSVYILYFCVIQFISCAYLS